MHSSSRTSPVRRFINLLSVDKQDILSIYIYAVFNGLLTLSLPIGIQAIINLITSGRITTSWIILVVLVIIGVALTGLTQLMQLRISENIQQKIFTRSAFEFAFRIPKLKMEAVDKLYVPELVNRFFDTLSVQKGLSKILIDFSSASLQVIFGLILLSLYHPFFILFSLMLVILVYVIFKFTAPRGLKSSLKESENKYRVAHWLEEIARSMETFKLAGNTPLPLNKTDELVSDYLNSRKTHFKTLMIQYINLIGFKVFITAGLLLIGGLLVINQQMNLGQFVAGEIIIILVLNSVEKLIFSMETIYDVLAAIEKIGRVTDLPLDSDKGIDFETDKKEALSVKLNDVSFGFEDEELILKNITLDIKAGEKLCLIGQNGSGKSLLLQLIAGLFENFKGSINYNGLPLGNFKKSALHSVISDNMSTEDIFQGSLEENISLGKEGVGMEEVVSAARIVGLEAFVSALPKGFMTELNPEGKDLPKSIRHKIILARSIAGNAGLILLEDNFSSLNEADKNRFLDHVLTSSLTVLAISSDKEVAKKFDRIVALDGGRIVADASIEELKSQNKISTIFQNK
jgi:ABC-type bacteriocin/lantibiotic exporter with double-glycine peptidase domain